MSARSRPRPPHFVFTVGPEPPHIPPHALGIIEMTECSVCHVLCGPMEFTVVGSSVCTVCRAKDQNEQVPKTDSKQEAGN